MVGNSEVKRTSPFVAFLFARLGALVESSSDPLGLLSPSDSYPQIEGFVFSGSGLGLVLGSIWTCELTGTVLSNHVLNSNLPTDGAKLMMFESSVKCGRSN